MAWIRIIPDREARGELRIHYWAIAASIRLGILAPGYRTLHGDAPAIFAAHGLDPKLMRLMLACSIASRASRTLPWRHFELVAASVSGANQCFY